VAVTLPDGQVPIAGDENNSGTLQSAELFNPADDEFTGLAASGDTECEGRPWLGWYDHTALVTAAHGFLTLER
jgi:hypothetical protein